MIDTRVLVLKFENPIHQKEITLFRGAVIQAISREANVLFHNHQEDNYRYSYPLIQYKRINGCAAIVCINQGTEAIGQFFSECNFSFQLANRSLEMKIDSVKANQCLVQLWESMFHYRIRKWLPLNSDNYKEYIQLDGLSEKIALLEKILIGNILSFTKGLGIYLESEIKCKLTVLNEPVLVMNKGVKLMSFDIEFQSNISLPDFIGIGKNASIGYGIVTQARTNKQ
jgi:hypothetical protein